MSSESPGAAPVLKRQAVEDALRDIAASERAIVAAYLFGSLARGESGPLSDVDIGLLLRDTREPRAVCDRAMDALSRRLRTPRIDVVDLEAVPMPVRYRIVRDGALVACRDAALVERFVADTVRHYLDFQPLRDAAFQVMRSAILGNA